MNSYQAAQLRLRQFEQRFAKELRKTNPKLLGDIVLSTAEVDEIGKCLRTFLIYRPVFEPQTKIDQYCLTISLFLVWCSAYHYKEGNFWAPIFNKLGIRRNARRCRELGDIFLQTLQDYRLQLPLLGKRKKYMTPILMHGYISDYYAPQLLDYLNVVYSSYLSYDLSAQSLNGLWEDLFNLDQEQIQSRDFVDWLRQQELKIESEMAALQLPPTLDADSKDRIEALERLAITHEKAVELRSQDLADLDSETKQLNEASSLFTECALTLEQINCTTLPIEFSSQQLKELGLKAAEGFERRFQLLQERKGAARRQLRILENARKVAERRKNVLLTELVKLGEGNLKTGYFRLEEYTNLARELEKIRDQRTRREKLLAEEEELGTAGLRQVLTVSLTSLAEANPTLLQEFIESTLHLLETYAREETIGDKHRLSQVLELWAAEPRVRQRLRRDSSPEPEKSVSPQAADQSTPFVRLKPITLRRPELKFIPTTRQLAVMIPAQDIPAPAGFAAEPRFGLNYPKKQEAIPCRYEIRRRRLITEDLHVQLTDQACTGVTFRWYNWHEYWDLSPEEIMVFDAKGRLLSGGDFPNGFYYIAARNGYETKSAQIITQYSCALAGYTVYEFNGVENRLEFASPEGETFTFSFSSHAYISLRGVEFIPGLRQGGLPVGKGEPVITIRRDFMDKTGADAVFVLNRNGGRLYKASLASVVDSGGSDADDLNCEIQVANFLEDQGRVNWQQLEIRIQGADTTYFTTKFCLVRVLAVSLEDGLLRVQVPAGSRLRGNLAKKDGRVYWLNCGAELEIAFTVYFPSIGWKDFSVPLPGGRWRLWRGSQKLRAPHVLLAVEANGLREMVLDFQTLSPAVQTVVVADDQKDLVMKFNAGRGDLRIPLENFADLFEGRQEAGRIELYCAGDLGSGRPEWIVEVYPRIDVEGVELFCAEQEDEYLLELSFRTDFPKLDRLQLRARTDDGSLLFRRGLRSNPDYFYLKKDGLGALGVEAQLFYEEEYAGVFGSVKQEIQCWQGRVNLPNRKAIYQRLQEVGLVLAGFTYETKYYELPPVYKITDIKISSRNFEGEELLNGLFHKDSTAIKVFFYVDYLDDQAVLSVLWDQDDDALQYDCRERELIWEVRTGRHVLGPLENFTFHFPGGSE